MHLAQCLIFELSFKITWVFNFKTSYWKIQLPILGGNKSVIFFFISNNHQRVFLRAHYLVPPRRYMLIKNLALCPPWDGIKTHILSAQGFHGATCSTPFAPVCRLSSFFFFPPPPATRFSTGGSRGRVVSEIMGRDSAQRDYLRDERSCSDRRAKCALWSSSSSKICLCNGGDFTSGRPRGWKPKSAVECAGILPLAHRDIYIYTCGIAPRVPLSSTSVVALGGGGGLTRCSEVKGHMSYTWPGTTQRRSFWLTSQNDHLVGLTCAGGPRGSELGRGHRVHMVRLRNTNQQAPQA